jgi:hypothetical protein
MAWYNCTIGANYTTKIPFQLHKPEPNYPKLQHIMYVHVQAIPKITHEQIYTHWKRKILNRQRVLKSCF